MLAAAVFLLSACSDKTTQAVKGTEAEEAIEQSRAECWQKAVLEPVYKTIGKVVMGMYEQLSAGSLSLIMIAFAVWMALRIMKFVSSVTEDSPGEVWNEIVRKAFLCLFCGFLASSSGMLLYVINTLIFPIYEAFWNLVPKYWRCLRSVRTRFWFWEKKLPLKIRKSPAR